jgi:hypothetical protein
MKSNRLLQYGSWTLVVAVLILKLNAQTPGASTLEGKWKLNTSKSQYQGAPRPTEASMVISVATASHFKFQLTGAFTGGGKTVWQEMGFDGAIDGKPYEYKGAQRGTTLSFVGHDGVLEGTAQYSGGMMMHEIISLSADGNTITSPSTLSSSKGTVSWTEVWGRVPDKKRK